MGYSPGGALERLLRKQVGHLRGGDADPELTDNDCRENASEDVLDLRQR